MAFMKTTFDLPDSLVKQVKLRALTEGRKLKDTVADLLRKALSGSEGESNSEKAVITKDKKTGLPLIQCNRTPAPEEISPDRLAEILLAQEVEWHHAAGRQ